MTLKGKHTVANQNSAGIEKGERIQNDDSRMNYFGNVHSNNPQLKG